MESTSDDSEPSYAIVNKQLQDVIRFQHTVIARMKAKMSRTDDRVSRDEYDKLVRELEEEKLNHVRTKAKLASESEKLQFALGEIDILNKQIQREKATFENVYGQVKTKAMEENQEKKQFLTKCQAMEELCSKQDDILTTKDAKIKELKQRLVRQKQVHQQQLSDLDIHRQQEQYINYSTQKSPVNPKSRTHLKRVSFR
ncbi:PREDICTED: spermatogenesis-associated protein 24-like isoform X1 [Acropora digitifera]|uniref:spermatogenesis-associated protein 24-like isoform X1 n=2 Tax=Acropora digitifera TaxID=70779 RepID=UPI00077AC520|nr:PREDICTED: spermatogenesis-associated protein 24-like isoform X1 [Acropora digitifera]